MLREARRRGPAAAVRAGEGAGRGPGREPAPSRRSPRSVPSRAGQGAGAGVCREAAAAAVAAGGGGRAGAGGRGEARGCFSCNLFTPPLYWGGREGSGSGRRPPRAACVCHSGIMRFAHSRPGPGGPSSRRGGRAGGSRGRRGWGSGSAGAEASAARPASWWGGRGRKTCEPWRQWGGTVARAGGGRNFCAGGKTLITFKEKGLLITSSLPPPFWSKHGPQCDRERKFKSRRFLPRLLRGGVGVSVCPSAHGESWGERAALRGREDCSPYPPFHGEPKVNVASVSLLPAFPPTPLPFPPPPRRFFEGTQKTESLSLCNFLGRCEHGPSPSLHPLARSFPTSGPPPEKCIRNHSKSTETKIDFLIVLSLR